MRRDRPLEYWAATADLVDLAGSIEQNVCRFYDRIGRGPLEDWRRASRMYFGRDPSGTGRTSHQVTSGGESGETPETMQNEFRSLLRHLLTLTTGTPPNVTARSKTPDYRSRTARQIAEAILDQAISEGTLEDRMVDACEIAIYLGEGYLYQWWDPDAGEQLDVEEVPLPGQDFDALEAEGAIPETMTRIVFSGDVAELALLPDDVIRDVSSEHWPESARWVIVRRRVNRYELAARHPEHSEHILLAEDDLKWSYTLRDEDPVFSRDGDDVTVFEFYHLSTHALPGGRASTWVGGQVIADGPLLYQRLPVHALIPARKKDEPFGYAKSFDLMAPQQAIDSAASTALANHDALGVQKLWARAGSGLEVRDLGGGVKVIESAEPPVPLRLMESNESSEKQAQYWLSAMERLSGVNSVSRGEPQASIKSGVALAFVDSKSIQSNSDLQRTYRRAWSDVASARIEIMRRFCSTPRLVEVSGKAKATSVQEFVGDDLSSIARISVEMGSPMQRTMSGRMAIADTLFGSQAISARQYVDMIATGRLDEVTDAPDRALSLIAQENEALLAGEQVVALKSDDPGAHVREHLAILADPQIRFDNAIVARVLGHVQEHMDLASQVMQAEPALFEMLGVPPIQSIAVAPPGPPGAPGAPPPGPPGAPGALAEPPPQPMIGQDGQPIDGPPLLSNDPIEAREAMPDPSQMVV